MNEELNDFNQYTGEPSGAEPTPEPSSANSWYSMPSEEPVPAPAAQPTRKEKKARRGMSTIGVIALCLVCAIIASVASAGFTYLQMRKGDSMIGEVLDSVVPTAVPVISTVSFDGASNDTAAYIYELAKQQVVGINTEITYGYNVFGQTSSASVTGSGVIITEDGYILTNYHVIEDANEGGYPVTVMLYDETTYDAEIIGFDADNDIALLKIDAVGLNAAQLGDSDDLVVGQTVYAVGNPLGELSYSMTSGIVSATNRTITTDSDVAVTMFQIDAAVNSGNSGGPVYNAAGQVIGIVTAKYGASGVEGLGFAIPVSDAAHIANQILEFGYVTDKASMGVSVASVSSSIADTYNMVVGAYVSEVNEDSAAEKAGLQVGDIITEIDGQEVAGASELTSLVKGYHAGDTAELTVWRAGEYLTLTITFDEKLPEEETEEPEEPASGEMPQGGQYYTYGDMEDFFRQFFPFGF